jgi:8-oxo-dGTP diphosphatase
MGAKDQGADAATVARRWQVVPRTLCFVTHGNEVLLLKRALHKRIFPGYFNGIGGHIERDEDPLSGAVREIYEETGLEVHNVRFCGCTLINAGQATGILLFIFRAEANSRAFTDSDEGALHWLSIEEILAGIQNGTATLPLVEDLPIILLRIFGEDRQPFFAHVSYDAQDRIQFRLADQQDKA